MIGILRQYHKFMKLLIHYFISNNATNSFEYYITIDMLIKEKSTTKLIDRQIP